MAKANTWQQASPCLSVLLDVVVVEAAASLVGPFTFILFVGSLSLAFSLFLLSSFLHQLDEHLSVQMVTTVPLVTHSHRDQANVPSPLFHDFCLFVCLTLLFSLSHTTLLVYFAIFFLLLLHTLSTLLNAIFASVTVTGSFSCHWTLLAISHTHTHVSEGIHIHMAAFFDVTCHHSLCHPNDLSLSSVHTWNFSPGVFFSSSSI